MAVSKDEILDSISKMTVLEVVELISDMEKKFGVTAAAPVAAAAAPGAAAAALPSNCLTLPPNTGERAMTAKLMSLNQGSMPYCA